MRTVIIARGKTYRHKDALKANGFRWDREGKVWVCLPEQDSHTMNRILSGLRSLPQVTAETADLDAYLHVFEAPGGVRNASPFVSALNEIDPIVLQAAGLAPAPAPAPAPSVPAGMETATPAEVAEGARRGKAFMIERLAGLRTSLSAILTEMDDLQAQIETA